MKKVLIANRGEIALRVQRACRKLGLGATLIASEADRNSYFARHADELVVIGPAPARESYLAMDKIIQVAISHGCDSVHPGYGFLSENADFARAVQKAGLSWIGPDPDSIDALGSKTEARARVRARGVPTTEGAPAGLSDDELCVMASRIGYPVIIKAVAGGGGRGMRIANSEEEMRQALPLARAEALKNFANEAVYFEQYIHEPRHVEVQIFGDAFGTVLHFGTRDCSTQRRHQKLVEEAPAPFLSDEMRAAIQNAAVEAGRSVNYKNAGTAEFLVKDDRFYFLEMNTRIQVEHPVTEMVTGVDLVELQLRIARGEPLPMKQEQVTFRGHVIEFRVYAEDPSANFMPSKGSITHLSRPELPFLREDHSIEQGDEVSLFYDAMLSKIIVHGDTRDEAIERAYTVLKDYQLEGIATTLPFHRWLLRLSPFDQGPLDIGYLGRHFTARCLEDLRLSEVVDPRHRSPIAGAELHEQLRYTSNLEGVEFVIDLVHKPHGVFLAVPCSLSGQVALPVYCRRSNGSESAVRAVIVEVIERYPSAQIFGEREEGIKSPRKLRAY